MPYRLPGRRPVRLHRRNLVDLGHLPARTLCGRSHSCLPSWSRQEDVMRDDLVPDNAFPDLRLPEHTGEELSLSEIAKGQPLVLCFVRGWWCPKEQIRVRNLVEMQDEIQREYGKIAAVTVDGPYPNGAFRAGVGANFPFLSDEDRRVAEELDLIELPDQKHRPYLPMP